MIRHICLFLELLSALLQSDETKAARFGSAKGVILSKTIRSFTAVRAASGGGGERKTVSAVRASKSSWRKDAFIHDTTSTAATVPLSSGHVQEIQLLSLNYRKFALSSHTHKRLSLSENKRKN